MGIHGVTRFILLSALGLSLAAIPSVRADSACNAVLSGNPLAISIHDLAKLRFNLDQKRAAGVSDAVTRMLETEYAKKESEVLALGLTREQIKAEIEKIQKGDRDATKSARQVREAQSEEAIQAEATATIAGHLSSNRYGHATIFLSKSQMLVWGGSSRHDFASPELYHLTDGQSTPINDRYRARDGANLFLMKDGQVVISGGTMGSTPISEIERYNPQTGKILKVGNWQAVSLDAPQVMLPDERIVAVAGRLQWRAISDIVEAYDSILGKVERIGHLFEPRRSHSVTVLSDGTLAVIGGENASGYLTSIERFDPTQENSKGVPVADLPRPIADPSSVLLHDGRVAIIGGRVKDAQALSSIEIFDPKQETCTQVADLHRARFAPFVKALSDGRVVIIGGSDSTGLPVPGMEIYDPDSNTVEIFEGLSEARSSPGIAISSDDEIWISGGFNRTHDDLSSIERIRVGRR